MEEHGDPHVNLKRDCRNRSWISARESKDCKDVDHSTTLGIDPISDTDEEADEERDEPKGNVKDYSSDENDGEKNQAVLVALVTLKLVMMMMIRMVLPRNAQNTLPLKQIIPE